MQSILNQPDADTWAHLAPLLDDAMAQLGETDRAALVLRFFENKTVPEIAGEMRVAEAAAQKRVARALEKLRAIFVKRGVTLSAVALGGTISANSVQAVQPSLIISTVAAAKGSAATSSTLTIIKGALKLMVWAKAKTAIVIGAGVLLAAGTTAVVVQTVNEREPSYHGKLLSEWTKYFFQPTATGYETTESGEATDAIQHMGKKAVPTLLKMVSSKKPFDNETNSFNFQMQAAGGFEALGPLAESAISELAKLVNQPKYVHGAARSLAGISPKAVKPLLDALNNTNPLVRFVAASALGSGFVPHSAGTKVATSPPLGSEVTATITALIRCTKDSDDTVRAFASNSLGGIGREPAAVIPVLIEVLNDNNSQCRAMAAQSLGCFGKEARRAIPFLTLATNDSDNFVQVVAKQALQRIDDGFPFPH